jgi:hypothetical protein
VRGIATSGWRGRSFFARHRRQRHRAGDERRARRRGGDDRRQAVDVDDARIVRAPASAVRDDSDLGDRLVVRAVPPLGASLVDIALARGGAAARAEVDAGRIIGAVLSLQGRWRVVGDIGADPGRAVAVVAPPVASRLRDEPAAVC